eukprot:scaffold61002_cov64-Phaeocystis_antarctica.AAC.5
MSSGHAGRAHSASLPFMPCTVTTAMPAHFAWVARLELSEDIFKANRSVAARFPRDCQLDSLARPRNPVP